MDRPYNTPGSVKRAREQAQGMLAREGPSKRAISTKPAETETRSRPFQVQPASQSIPVKSRAPLGYESKPGQTISRPTQVPQWPLTGSSLSSPAHEDSNLQSLHQTKPQQTPQRPPRPSQSRIPSMLDQSGPQQPTPVFTSQTIAPESPQDSTIDSYSGSSPSSNSARQTVSSVGTVPEFPAPAPANTSGTPRKGAALGPPPSSRRGASCFYSSASFVSPIPEESPRMKSHGSYASSAAMPDSWVQGSPETPSALYGEAFDEESMTEKSPESTYDDYGDESQLVRSASLGKKGKPELINTKSSGEGATSANKRTLTTENDVYLGAGTSLSEAKKLQASRKHTTNADSLSSDAFLKAFAAASSSDVKESIPLAEAPRQHSRLSAMRRPPRIDIDAVRAAEARGSLTSLPDLIRRATRLAAMIDKGKRPASRLDTLDGFLNEKDDRHQSGFSDMLAAFPPPVHTPRNNTAPRSSWLRSTWPAVQGQRQPTHSRSPSGQVVAKPKRRCCGLPIWALILLVSLMLCLIVAAIVVPLEFFVFKNLGNNDKQEPSLSQCQNTLACLNGGTSVIVRGSCSCICTNGFTGSTCGDGGATGCAMTNLVSADGRSNIHNVTLGQAIPRLLADANQNFSVPLSGTTILASFNAGNLSCIAQNSIVTFDGRSTRSGQPTDVVEDVSRKQANLLLNAERFPPISIITFTPTTTTTITVPAGGHSSTPRISATTTAPTTAVKSTTRTGPGVTSAITPTSMTVSTPGQVVLPTTLVVDTGTATTTGTAPVTSAFVLTEEKVDFARIAMLYILQEESVEKAISAQGVLQQLFRRMTRSKTQPGNEVSLREASNVELGSANSINLVDLTVNVGKGPIGRED
ncbi:hypothetical protein C2857_003773 [Epichloe festucae Fl1]|uniref:EGF-like domain-containing protein n=1 Tax=Epichloe festucae (strain Fl1) TaxID=877507 RepID=A0A7U3SNJ4_EPIFF|nr:hypothetical protein C2857_003773 [Epichloe festucae Fl1]